MKKEKAVDEKKIIEEATDKAFSEPLSKKESAENQKNTRITFSSNTSARFGIVTIILAVMGIAISIDSLVKVKEWGSGLKTFKDQIEKHYETEQQRLASLENSLRTLDARQDSFDKQLGEYHTTLSAITPLLQKDHPVDLMWQLQKIYDWLQEAELDLQWGEDWENALSLLQAADNVMAQLKIASLQPIHELLSQDITALSAIKPINETLLLQQIKSISDALVTLPVPTSATTQPSSSSTKPTSSGWRAVVNSGFEWIQKVVVIKPADSTQPLPQIQSRRILNENLIIALQQTQWALLKKDNVLFHWSVEQVTQMIQNNGMLIDLNAPQTAAFLQSLNGLAQQNFAPTLPSVQPICQQLKAYMNTLNVSEKLSERQTT